VEKALNIRHHIIALKGNYLSEFDFKPILEEVEDQVHNQTFHFIIDLEHLKFLNSSGLGALIRILTKARTAGGEAVLANGNDQISQLLVISKLHQVFKTFDSTQSAIKHFLNSKN